MFFSKWFGQTTKLGCPGLQRENPEIRWKVLLEKKRKNKNHTVAFVFPAEK